MHTHIDLYIYLYLYVGTTINLPLPPGCGSGAYEYAFQKVVIPALEKFQPDIIFVRYILERYVVFVDIYKLIVLNGGLRYLVI
jgi:hypothetical protein